MQPQELLSHLFREQYSKIIAVLCKRFGFEQMEIAEDIAGDTFLTAAQTWGLNGVPANPVAWLYAVAKNKAKNQLQRQSIYENKIVQEVTGSSSIFYEDDIDLSPQHISDSQLQMMFAICHPCLSAEAQIGLSLRILCGFGIDEIAEAFLTGKETINKRLYRAKEKLRATKIKISFPEAAEISARLENVLTTIYLLFSEGYYSVSRNQTINKELCFEAIRLCHLLTDNELTNQPQVNALLSLMYFHASRLDARVDNKGELVLYDEQDTAFWDYEMITKGGYYLNHSATGATLSSYHLQAAIAYWNTRQIDDKEKWENILQLYNRLLQVAYTPIAALNRTYALSKANGKKEAIIMAEKLKLVNTHFYFMLLGELYTGIDNGLAKTHFEKALSLAITPADKQAIHKKLISLF